MSAPPETTADATAPEARSALAERLQRRRSKRGLLERVSIQSKLMLMLLTTGGAMTIAVVTGIRRSRNHPA
jgi:hypothetical protein